MLEAIHITNTAWQTVSEDAISNCFHHTGFLKKEVGETEPPTKGSKQLNTETEDFNHLMQTLPKQF